MRHLTKLADLGPEGVRQLLERALAWKKQPPSGLLAGKILGMVFFNPSLRTRTSFEAALLRSGGHAICLNVGAGLWKLEHGDGVRMDGDKAESIREAAPVLSQYVDILAIRSFAELQDRDEDERDTVINGFRRHAQVPVISMESAREHPCQGLADMLTLRERYGKLSGLPLTLTWAPHIKPLPTAVPHSFLLTAAACGAALRVAHPDGFVLHPRVLAEAQQYAAESGGSIEMFREQAPAIAGSAAVYAKSWGGSRPSAAPELASWMLRPESLEPALPEAPFLHCLPIRRGVVASDSLLDGPRSAVVAQAGNRFDVQRAALAWLLER